MIKEAEEEANLKIKPSDIEFVAKIKSLSTRYFCTLYLLRSNQTPDYNKDDFKKAKWLTPSELIEKIDSGHIAKSDLRKSVVILQTYLEGI
ncbi:MAG: NUDIX hydrolase [Candidatus Saccharimonadales bacterium]